MPKPNWHKDCCSIVKAIRGGSGPLPSAFVACLALSVAATLSACSLLSVVTLLILRPEVEHFFQIYFHAKYDLFRNWHRTSFP